MGLDGSVQKNCSSSHDLLIEGGQESVQYLPDEVDLIETDVWWNMFGIAVPCDADPKEVASVARRRSFEEFWDFSLKVYTSSLSPKGNKSST